MNRAWIVVIALAALAVGCKESTSANADAEAASSFCRARFGAVYDRRAACESWSAAYRDLRIGDLEAGCAPVGLSVAAGREHFYSRNGVDCLSWWKTTYASASCSADDPTPPATCDEVIQPAVPLGGECVDDADCIDGWCSRPAGTCGGSCVALGAEGEPCRPLVIWPDIDGTCRSGLTCNWTGSFSCGVPPIPAGEGSPCGIGTPCGAGLYCQFSGEPNTPICKPTAVVGLGDPCSASNVCPAGLVCGTQRVCAQYAGEGASCTTPAECGAGLFCNGSICEALPDIGASCAVSQLCLRGYCSSLDSVCQPPKANGQPCADFDECESYLCTDSFCEPPTCP
jgi:hypothetical protein